MPVATNQIRIAELDFDQILLNLVAFMKADPAFADYDFAGSGLRLLTRVLAYVTFYNAYYLNTAINEAFLDTAQLRSSVASHARMLGYQIRGVRSAALSANVVVSMTDTFAGTVTLPKASQFALIANASFTFYNLVDTVLAINTVSQQYEAHNVPLTEGRPLKYQFTVDLTDPAQRFIIPNANIDYSTIAVTVQASGSSNVVTLFQPVDNLLTITATDPVFFVQETNSFPELTFGNGVIGLPLQQGNIVLVDYFASRGADGNNIRGPFRLVTPKIPGFVQGNTIIDGDTVPSTGGADTEDIETVRFLAPLTYSAQNRAVTTADYKALILREYGDNVSAINVFGGEQGDPTDPQGRPVFGRVFVVLKPKIGLRFTDVTRGIIETSILQPHSVVGVIPQVIDPEYTYINVNTFVKYDTRATTRTQLQLEQTIANSISTYAAQNIELFDTQFRFSRLVRSIDDSDEAIMSSLTRLDLEQRVFPQLGISNQFILKFNVPVRQNGTTSVILEATTHRFTYPTATGGTQDNCFFVEQDSKVHVAFRDKTNTVTIVKADIGVINKDIGLITIADFQPVSIENNELDVRFRIIPAVNDFTPQLNQLFTIDPASIIIHLADDATASAADASDFFSGLLP